MTPQLAGNAVRQGKASRGCFGIQSVRLMQGAAALACTVLRNLLLGASAAYDPEFGSQPVSGMTRSNFSRRFRNLAHYY
jgi:hypothetical protein